MKKEIEKSESVKTKRFAVLDGNTLVIATEKKEEADEKFDQLKKELKPLIVFIDHEVHFSVRATKTIHQQNYRIKAGNYEKDSALKPAPDVTETEE
jgi:hypothetical protein